MDRVNQNRFIRTYQRSTSYTTADCKLTDDLKHFRKICEPSDPQLLQLDLGYISDWCSNNLLTLSIKKYNSVSFIRSNTLISFEYKINCVRVEILQSIKDIFDKKFTFKEHINYIFWRSMRLNLNFEIFQRWKNYMFLL